MAIPPRKNPSGIQVESEVIVFCGVDIVARPIAEVPLEDTPAMVNTIDSSVVLIIYCFLFPKVLTIIAFFSVCFGVSRSRGYLWLKLVSRIVLTGWQAHMPVMLFWQSVQLM